MPIKKRGSCLIWFILTILYSTDLGLKIKTSPLLPTMIPKTKQEKQEKMKWREDCRAKEVLTFIYLDEEDLLTFVKKHVDIILYIQNYAKLIHLDF